MKTPVQGQIAPRSRRTSTSAARATDPRPSVRAARTSAAKRFERDFCGLIDSSPDGVLVHRAGRVVYANPALKQMLGVPSKTDMAGQDMRRWIFPDDASAWEAILERRPPLASGTELHIVCGDARVALLEIVAVNAVHFSGKDAALIVARDITERRRLEREIVEISTHEQERIGQDLHDGLCQHLAGIVALSGALARQLEAQSRPESGLAREITELVKDAVSQARDLARGLYPPQLRDGGLTAALDGLTSQVQAAHGVACRFIAHGAPRLECPTAATHLYRIAQEALRNAVTHSHGDTIELRLQAGGRGGVTLTVADNGRGLGSPAPARSGLGLHTMAYRARMIGASLTVAPGPGGRGTEVSCVVHPCERKFCRWSNTAEAGRSWPR